MKELRPLVSIIMPLYNSAKFVEASIESVLSQSEDDWELILIDDLSTDNTLQIVRPFLKDNRIKLIELDANSGAAVARNAGIKSAQGRFVSFLDSDDLWLSIKLRTQVDFMISNNAAFTYTDYQKINEDGHALGNPIIAHDKLDYQSMLRANQIGCLTVMYDSDQLGYITMPLLRKRQDYALWLKIIRINGPALRVPRVLSLYRVRKGSISSNKVEMLKYNWLVFREAEGFGFFKSLYYLAYNVAHRIMRLHK